MYNYLLKTLLWSRIRNSLALALILFLGVQVAVASHAWAQQPSPTFDITQVTAPVSPPVASSGHATFQEKCSPCHGTTGMGDGPTAKDLPSPPAKFADPATIFERKPAELFYTAKFGRLEKLMPPWKDQLSDDQIWQALAYVWSLHTDETYVSAGKDLYTVSCASCHGDGGAGDGPNATPNMNNFADLNYAITHSQSDWIQGWQSAHPEIGADWSLDDQQKVLEYIRTFSYVPPWQSPYRAGNGIIDGAAVQRSSDGGAVEGMDVKLEAFVDFQRVAFFTSTVGADGQFHFEQLATDPSIVYMASVTSDGISYSSPILSLSPQTSTLTTTVSIFGQTDDPSGIMIDRAHWILDSQPGALIVGEIFEFSNSLDRTFTGTLVDGIDQPVTIALPVPPDAQEINFENGALGERFLQKGNLIYDTTPIVPGKSGHQIILRYAIPTTGKLDLSLEYLYPVGDLTILLSELPGIQAQVPDLNSMGSQSLQGDNYLLWQGQALMPGKIPVSLSGLLDKDSIDPRTVQSSDGSSAATVVATNVPQLEDWTTWLLGGLLVLPLAGVLAWSLRSGSLQRAGRGANLRERHNELLKQIAKLDDLHSLDQIDTASWQKQRAALKAELLEVNSKM